MTQSLRIPNPTSFSSGTLDKADCRQDGRCAACGADLRRVSETNAHHRRPKVPWGGSDSLRNCVLLCRSGPNCHLNVGHDGDWNSYAPLNDKRDLPYLYAGR
ncbi:MAG: HNH endonuclease [Chloroflexi bacterium]|nr:HNH endonuclease [Chloroflexota bacterium]